MAHLAQYQDDHFYEEFFIPKDYDSVIDDEMIDFSSPNVNEGVFGIPSVHARPSVLNLENQADHDNKNLALSERSTDTPILEAFDQVDGPSFSLRSKSVTPPANTDVCDNFSPTFVQSKLTPETKIKLSKRLEENPKYFVKCLFKAVKRNNEPYLRALVEVLREKQKSLSCSEFEELDCLEESTTSSLLHVALLYDNTSQAIYLAKTGGCELICKPYSCQSYKGQTAFHIAAANGNIECMRYMLKSHSDTCRCKEKLNHPATGTYFQTDHPCGELCTTVTVWAQQKNMCEMLKLQVENGANLSMKNHLGNTVLHCIIQLSMERNSDEDIDDLLEAYKTVRDLCKTWTILRSPRKPKHNVEGDYWCHEAFRKLLHIQNNEGLTPLAMAAKLGSPLLGRILQVTDKIYIMNKLVFGTTSWVTYDVTYVTSYTVDISGSGPNVKFDEYLEKSPEEDLDISTNNTKRVDKSKVGKKNDDDVAGNTKDIAITFYAERSSLKTNPKENLSLRRTGNKTTATEGLRGSRPRRHWRYNHDSVLHYLAHNSEHLFGHGVLKKDIFDEEPISTLVNTKWEVYRWVYYLWGLIHIIYMSIFTHYTLKVIPYQNSTLKNTTDQERSQIDQINFDYIAFIILPLIYIGLEIVDMYRSFRHRFVTLSKTKLRYKLHYIFYRIHQQLLTGNAPYRFKNLVFCTSSITWLILYLTNNQNQDIALSMTLVSGWLFLLFFTRGLQAVSKFSIMIQKMFFHDLIYFLLIYCITLVAFSMAMHALVLSNHPGTYMDLNETIFRMLNTVLEVSDQHKQSPDDTRVKPFSRILVYLYAIFTAVLLLNMLIAMLNTSYGVVRETHYAISKRQRLSIMMMLERRLCWITPLCKLSQRQIIQDQKTGRLYLGTKKSRF